MKINLIKDSRGILAPLELKDIPFTVKRIFCVYDVPPNTLRGNHAHYTTKQYLFCLKGKIEVRVFNKKEFIKKILNPGEGYFVDRLIWDIQKFIDKNSILLVCCSTNFSKKDYIFDLKEFVRV